MRTYLMSVRKEPMVVFRAPDGWQAARFVGNKFDREVIFEPEFFDEEELADVSVALAPDWAHEFLLEDLAKAGMELDEDGDLAWVFLPTAAERLFKAARRKFEALVDKHGLRRSVGRESDRTTGLN